MIFFTFVEIFNEVKVYTDLDNLKIEKPVVTIGVFDGLHKGHQKLLELVCRKADELGGESVVITFWPHPRMVLGKEDPGFQLLSTLEEKELLMRKWGVNNLIILPFTKEFSQISGRSFIKDMLVDKIGIKYLFVGDDHRFGSDRDGGKQLLIEMGSLYGFGITNLDSQIEGSSRISSSLVRQALNSGDLAKANSLLGFPFMMLGKVVEGSQMGRKIGFPTANIECCIDNKQIPEQGVYVVKVNIGDEELGGMLNIGTRPTIDKNLKRSIEVHIFDLSRDLYGQKLLISFIDRLRDEMKFKNVDELKIQLIKDRQDALALLNEMD